MYEEVYLFLGEAVENGYNFRRCIEVLEGMHRNEFHEEAVQNEIADLLRKQMKKRIEGKDLEYVEFKKDLMDLLNVCSSCMIIKLNKDKYMNALSRKDNETYICEACGMREALEEFEKYAD